MNTGITAARLVLTNGATEEEVPLGVVTGRDAKNVGLTTGGLREKHDVFFLDSGFSNTGIHSAVTYIDGDKGELWYRGYPIRVLAQNCSYLEVAWLLRNGRLPTGPELQKYVGAVDAFRTVPTELSNFLASAPGKTHPMSILSMAFSALSGIYPQHLAVDQPDSAMAIAMGHMPSLVAIANCRQFAKRFDPTSAANCPFEESFLPLLWGPGRTPTTEQLSALRVLLILHADHEQNCSTSSVRMVGSSLANLFASITAGMNALWGPAHGGANEAVRLMFDQILERGLTADQVVSAAKEKRLKVLIGYERLMGFGHRVYKNCDPRANLLRELATTLLQKAGGSKLFDLALKLAETALSDQYFIERDLYPNVDFWSGFVYALLDIDPVLWTSMFAYGRLAGWIAHWDERRLSKAPIDRPWQLYNGPELNRPFIQMSDRAS